MTNLPKRLDFAVSLTSSDFSVRADNTAVVEFADQQAATDYAGDAYHSGHYSEIEVTDKFGRTIFTASRDQVYFD